MSNKNVLEKLKVSEGKRGFKVETLKKAIDELNKSPDVKISKTGVKKTLSSSILKAINKKLVSKKVIQKTITVLFHSETKDVKVECFKGHEIEKILGKGGGGVVLNTCLKKNCKYALKILNAEPDAFKFEVEATKIFDKHGVGPKFFGNWTCDGMGFILTEMWDRALTVKDKLDSKLYNKIESQLDTIHRLGYIHADVFRKNLLVKEKGGKIVDITLTDFGLSDTILNYKRDWGPASIKEMYDYHNGYFKNLPPIGKVMVDPTILDTGLLKFYKNMI